MTNKNLTVFHFPCTDGITWFILYLLGAWQGINLDKLEIYNIENYREDWFLLMKLGNEYFVWWQPSLDNTLGSEWIKNVFDKYWLINIKFNKIKEIDIFVGSFYKFLMGDWNMYVYDHHSWNLWQIEKFKEENYNYWQIKIEFNEDYCGAMIYYLANKEKFEEKNIKINREILDLICKADTYSFDINNDKEVLDVLSFASFIKQSWKDLNTREWIIENFNNMIELIIKDDKISSNIINEYTEYYDFYVKKIFYYINTFVNKRNFKVIDINWIRFPVIFINSYEFNDLSIFIFRKLWINVFWFLNITIMPDGSNAFSFSVRSKKWEWKALEIINKLKGMFPKGEVTGWWHPDACGMTISFDLVKSNLIKFEYFK